jgi:hypothetical protein
MGGGGGDTYHFDVTVDAGSDMSERDLARQIERVFDRKRTRQLRD